MTTYTKEKQSADRDFDAKVRNKSPDVWAALIRDKIPEDKHLAAWVAKILEFRLMDTKRDRIALQAIMDECSPFHAGERSVMDAQEGLLRIGLKSDWQSYFSKQEKARAVKRKAKKGRVAA